MRQCASMCVNVRQCAPEAVTGVTKLASRRRRRCVCVCVSARDVCVRDEVFRVCATFVIRCSLELSVGRWPC